MRAAGSFLGTPGEDLANLAAVHSLDLPCKLLTCLGFGVDSFDGVSHAHVLEAVAELQPKELDAVVRRCLSLPELRKTKSYLEVERVIDDFRRSYPPRRNWEPIPY